MTLTRRERRCVGKSCERMVPKLRESEYPYGLGTPSLNTRVSGSGLSDVGAVKVY